MIPYIGNGTIWMLSEKLGIPPFSPVDAVYRKFGLKGLRKAYLIGCVM